MTSLEERTREIIEFVGEEFNSLPKEERKRINKFLSYMQILTIWQMINKDGDIVTHRWRETQRKWLRNCVERHLKEWWYE